MQTSKLSSTASSSILEFLLGLTKFVGENNISILECVLGWTTVFVFGLRYVIDYGRIRWKLYRMARQVVVKSTMSSIQIATTRSVEQLHATEFGSHDDKMEPSFFSNSLVCEFVSLCPLARTRAELSVGIDERWERLRHELFLASSSVLDHNHNNDRVGEKDINDSNDYEKHDDDVCEGDGITASSSLSRIAVMTSKWTDEDWVKIFHSSLAVRRETSYLMFALSSDGGLHKHDNSILLSKLRRLWPRLLELPRSVVCDGAFDNDGAKAMKTTNDDETLYNLSLIIPVYKERFSDIADTLDRAFNSCRGDPEKIQVVIAHAESSPRNTKGAGDSDVGSTESGDSCGGLLLRKQLLLEHAQRQQRKNRKQPREELGRNDENIQRPSSFWGELKVVTIPLGKGGGRGKTLNIGANHATAPILTFLHVDTKVPFGWDEQIQAALLWRTPSSSTGMNSIESKPNQLREHDTGASDGNPRVFPHACAFTMAIDKSDAGNKLPKLPSPSLSYKPSNLPPGLRGAEWLGVLRCHCGLPYGDSILSFLRPMFDYMGGYPDQPLMEDYEVMDWLRLRSFLFSAMSKMTAKRNNGNHIDDGNPNQTHYGDYRIREEGLVLMKDRAWCSPRRWKKYGVAYTSLINAICIHRYRNMAITAEDLFDFYYHCNSSSLSKSNSAKNE